MEIAYLIPTIDRIAGAERQLQLLATGMAERGWKVTVIALSGTGGDFLRDLPAHQVSFLSLGMRKGLADPRGWIRLHRFLDAHQPDVVHAHLPHAALLARWSRFAAPVRVLIDTIHSPACGGTIRRFGYRISSWLPDMLTAVSLSAAEPWLKAQMLHGANLAIIPNGIAMDYFKRDDGARKAARSQSGFTNEFVWLSVGRLDPVKDHVTLLRAFARLPVKAHLVLAGTGPLETMLRQLSSELGVASRVTFLGFQREMLAWMQLADAFVLNSLWEGLPLALIEAGACELPAVITNTPGAREVLSDLPVDSVPVGDPDALAAAMSALMSVPLTERRNLGIRGRQSVLARFDIHSVLDSYEALYRSALAVNQIPSRWRTSRSPSAALSCSNTTGK